MHNLYPIIDPVHSILPVISTTTQTGDAVDLGTNPRATVFIDCGTVTDGTHTFELQECATSNGTFTAVAAADMTGDSEPVMESTNEEDIFVIDYVGTKRYLKGVITVTGSPSTGATIGVIILKHPARHQPAQDTFQP